MLTLLILLLPLSARAHPPVERLDDLINGLCDECLCEPACEPIVESKCTDIECACSLQFQAQDCVMDCMKTQDSVNLYNDYLDSCVKESLAVPTATLAVHGSGQSASGARMGGFGGVQSSAAAASGGHGSFNIKNVNAAGGGATGASEEGSYPGVTDQGSLTKVAAALPSGLYATGSGGSVMTGLSGMSITSVNAVAYDSLNGASVSTAVVGGTGSTPALDATDSFFGSPVSQDCVTPCQSWKNQAAMCTNDTCLCTPETYSAAQQCSECNGSNGLNGRNVPPAVSATTRTDKTMGYWYSKFSEACQARNPGISNGAAGQRQGYTGIDVVPSGSLGYATSAAYGRPSVKPMMITDGSGRTMIGDGSEYSTSTVTATAAAMYAPADQTIVIDSSAVINQHPLAWSLVALCLCLCLCHILLL